jgi:hypothetical protein
LAKKKKKRSIQILQVTSVNAVLIVGSVAAEETALAALIQAEANKLTSASAGGITVEEFRRITQSIIRTMKTVLLKNTVLEVKLRENLNFIRAEGIDPTNLNELLNNLVAVLRSIGEEEVSLGNLIDRLGVAIIDVAPAIATFEDVQAVDNSVRALMKVIVQKNMVLLRKLRTTVQFIQSIGVVFPPDVLATLQDIIRNFLIRSIQSEESGLSQLISGESIKFSTALAIGLTVDELLALNSLVTGIMDTVVQKNMILEAKLEEIIALIGLAGFAPDILTLIANTLTIIQGTIAQEETALARIITEEANKLNQIIALAPGNIETLIDANESVTTLLESITLKNMVLEQKSEEVINFIQANT